MGSHMCFWLVSGLLPLQKLLSFLAPFFLWPWFFFAVAVQFCAFCLLNAIHIECLKERPRVFMKWRMNWTRAPKPDRCSKEWRALSTGWSTCPATHSSDLRNAICICGMGRWSQPWWKSYSRCNVTGTWGSTDSVLSQEGRQLYFHRTCCPWYHADWCLPKRPNVLAKSSRITWQNGRWKMPGRFV